MTEVGFGRPHQEPPTYYGPYFRYVDGKPVCKCGRDVGRFGVLFCCELVGEPKDGRLEGRCKRCYDEVPVLRQKLERIGRIYDAGLRD